MGRKRHTPEQIITALREAEIGLARGKSVKLMSRVLGQLRTTQRRARKVASDEGARSEVISCDSRVDSAATATDASRILVTGSR